MRSASAGVGAGMKKPRKHRVDEDTTGEPPTNKILIDIIGPRLPPMIAWQRAGEPGWPLNYDGGPMPGTINDKRETDLFD